MEEVRVFQAFWFIIGTLAALTWSLIGGNKVPRHGDKGQAPQHPPGGDKNDGNHAAAAKDEKKFPMKTIKDEAKNLRTSMSREGKKPAAQPTSSKPTTPTKPEDGKKPQQPSDPNGTATGGAQKDGGEKKNNDEKDKILPGSDPKQDSNGKKTTEERTVDKTMDKTEDQAKLTKEGTIDAAEGVAGGKPKALTPHYTAAGPNTFELRSLHTIFWTQGQEIERRTHRIRTFISVFKTCDVCTKRFGITAQNALKCVDCDVRFHQHCQSRAPMPCVPKVPMPKTSSKQRCPLVQYCPETHPFIPPIMIFCIVALERDHLTKEGIYRLPGADQGVAKLYQKFMSERKVPNLSNVETENITGCVKKFLKELEDSLIPSTSYDDFIQAVESDNEQALIHAVFELSAPNRDTLAYFILHLQNVAKHSSHNKMPIENLARVLAPTVVGYSKLVTPCLENVQELNRNQYMILLRLLQIPTEYWSRFIENNMSDVLAAESRTSGSKAALLTVTSTKPSISSSRRGGGYSNNNSSQLDSYSENSTQKSTSSSPLIQPLSMASS